MGSRAQVQQKNRAKGIAGSTLKIIAIITMLIDHIGAVVVERMIMRGVPFFGMSIEELYLLDQVLRSIGRIGFPLFCFLLVEGFMHTKSRTKYALRLGAFALLSEIPFNLAFAGKVFFPKYQNVFFTLLIGFLVMCAFSMIEEKLKVNKVLQVILQLVVLLAGMGVALLLKTDYDYLGVISITVLYVFRFNRSLQMLFGAASFLWEIPAPFAFVPAYFYNGERGLKLKFLFYAFYPVHLLILYYVAVILGIA